MTYWAFDVVFYFWEYNFKWPQLIVICPFFMNYFMNAIIVFEAVYGVFVQRLLTKVMHGFMINRQQRDLPIGFYDVVLIGLMVIYFLDQYNTLKNQCGP